MFRISLKVVNLMVKFVMKFQMLVETGELDGQICHEISNVSGIPCECDNF